MSELVGQGSKYTDEQRREAAILFATKGNISATSTALDIPRTTIGTWTKEDWWDQIVSEVRQEKADEHIANYHALVTEGQRIALEKLPEASARDAMIIAATATDKARLLLNQPTSISGKHEGMTELMRQFEQLADSYREKQANVVATQEPNESGPG